MYTSFGRQHPDITIEMWDQIDAVIDRWKDTAGAIISVLRECQDVVGYLPLVLIDYIARGMNLAQSEVFGVASFYALFSMTPKGRNVVKVCMGTACYVKGMNDVLVRIKNAYKIEEGGTTEDRRFSLEAVRCLGACGLAPVMTINTDTHGDVSADTILDVIETYQ